MWGPVLDIALYIGKMAEWSKAAVLKAVVRKHPGFESPSSRKILEFEHAFDSRGLKSNPQIYIYKDKKGI